MFNAPLRGENEFAKGNSHINGIESFWGYSKNRLVKFTSVREVRNG
jgi:transposase